MSKDTEKNLIKIQPGQAGKNHPAKKPESQIKKMRVAIRLTPDEHKKLEHMATVEGLSVSKYIRQKVGL